jgi:phosphatidate phosphatase LPIN
MFGRKTVKNNAHAVDRVSSLERAEIAAELLDSKWSTNLPRSSKPHSNDESSKSKLAEASNSNQMETTKTVLPEHSLDHGKETDSNCNSCSPRGGRNSLEDETDQCLQTTSVKEEVVEIHTREASDFTDMIISTVHQPGSESFSNDVGTDKSLHGSVDTQGELLHNLEDVAGREIHTKEALSNGVFEIHTVDTGTTSGKSEVVSQFVTVDSYGASQNLTGSNSPACAITDEKHEVALIPSAQDPVQEKVVILSSSETVEISQDSVQEKMVIFSSSETLESSYAVSNISDDKAHDASDISLADSVQREEHSGVFDGSKEQVFSEERSSAFSGASSNKKDVIEVVVEEHGAFISEDPASQILQGNGPDMDISLNSVSLSHTDGVHDFTCQHDVVCPDDSSSVVETSSYVPDDDPQDLTKNVIVENQACNRELDVSVTQTSTIGDESTESNVQSANFPNKIEVVSSPTVTGSSSFVGDPEGVAQNFIEENKACSREPCVSFTLTPTIGDEPTECIAQSANFPDKMETEGSQTVTGSSSLVNDPEDVTESLIVENKACSRELDVSVIQASTIGDESTESNVQLANFPNKIEVVSSPTATVSSSFFSDPEDVAQNLIEENKACSREPCVSFTLTSTIGDEPTECIAQSANFPDKMEAEGSQTVTRSSSLVTDPEDVTESLIVENKACSREPDVSVILTSTIGDGSTEFVAQSADFPNKIEVEEGSPTATGSSNLVYGEGETGRPSSTSGDEVGFVLEATAEPEEEADARVSFSEYTEEIQFQFSDTENFADRKIMDDVVADKTAGEGEHEESDCDTEKQEEGDLDLANELENCSDSLRPTTSPVSIPTCNLQLEDNTMEAKSLPNLRSHIHDLERSDSFKLSRSLQPIAENNGVDPVKSTNSSFLEQKPEVSGDLEENSSPPEVTSNVVPGDNHADNVKIDSFVPFAGEFFFLLGLAFLFLFNTSFNYLYLAE